MRNVNISLVLKHKIRWFPAQRAGESNDLTVRPLWFSALRIKNILWSLGECSSNRATEVAQLAGRKIISSAVELIIHMYIVQVDIRVPFIHSSWVFNVLIEGSPPSATQTSSYKNESTKVHNPRRNQSTGITRIRYGIRGSGLAMRARYLPRIGTVRYRYIPVLGMLYTYYIP